MSLFDSKEEVIELVLTGYGKHKLSIGEFEPEYYAFYDDGVLTIYLTQMDLKRKTI